MDDRNQSASPTRSWCSERMRQVFAPLLEPEIEARARELVRGRKVLDFMVQPGVVSARVQQDSLRPQRIGIHFQPIDDNYWERIFDSLSDKSYFLARMLAGDFPDELETVAIECGTSLFPESIRSVGLSVDGQDLKAPSPLVAAVTLRLLEVLDQEPFSLFTILGRGREETIAEVRRLRAKNEPGKVAFLPPSSFSADSSSPIETAPAHPLRYQSSRGFWSMDPAIKQLQYTIKADELPASILRWLDPIPLNGLEEHVDHLLEEAYARVARLAQSFGIGL